MHGGAAPQVLTAAWRYQAGAGEQIRAEVALYERALDRTARLLADMARLNLDERLERLTEAQGQQIVAVVRFALLELGADPGEPAVQQAVMRQLAAKGATR
jgi:F0F1-type ATP synthase membrane subunit b/b'